MAVNPNLRRDHEGLCTFSERLELKHWKTKKLFESAVMEKMTLTHQALRYKENLTLPSVQVIVMNANMGCSHCRQRVSQMILKINGVIDCVVDVKKRQVILRGLMNSNKSSLEQFQPKSRVMKQNMKKSLGCFPPLFGAY